MQGDFFLHVVRSLTPRKTAKIALVMYFQPIGLAFAYCYSIFNRRKSSPAANSTLALLAPFSNTFQRSGLVKRTILLPSSAPFLSVPLFSSQIGLYLHPSDRHLQIEPEPGDLLFPFVIEGLIEEDLDRGKGLHAHGYLLKIAGRKVGGSLQGQAGGKGEIED